MQALYKVVFNRAGLRTTKMKPPVRRNNLVFPELSYQLVAHAYYMGKVQTNCKYKSDSKSIIQ